MKIEVKDMRPIDKGSLRGFCTVRFPDSDLEFRDVRIIRQEGQKGFVVGPQREYEKDGVKKYVALVWWGKDSKLGADIQKTVLSEWEKQFPPSSPSFDPSSDIPF